jgi:hypothetical protein
MLAEKAIRCNPKKAAEISENCAGRSACLNRAAGWAATDRKTAADDYDTGDRFDPRS